MWVKSEYEYAKFLARRLGFASYNDYLDHLAARKGFKNRSEQQRASEKKRGFNRPIDYKNHLARQRGFKDYYEYRRHAKNKRPAHKKHSEKKTAIDAKPKPPADDDWMYKPLLNTNTRCDYDGNKINFEWMEA
jgi:uncharacterized short protein YbdD (DUF466 family)